MPVVATMLRDLSRLVLRESDVAKVSACRKSYASRAVHQPLQDEELAILIDSLDQVVQISQDFVLSVVQFVSDPERRASVVGYVGSRCCA